MPHQDSTDALRLVGSNAVGPVPHAGWTASQWPHNSTCRRTGHCPDEPAMEEAPGTSARVIVYCRTCGAYMAAFEGPPDAVRAATAHWLHRESEGRS